jgi:hypothetical protein
MHDRGDERDAAEELQFLEIDRKAPQVADRARQPGCARSFQRRDVDHEVTKIETVTERGTAQQHKNIRLTGRRYERPHAECWHDRAEVGNRFRAGPSAFSE